jgi:hypothetical protein
MISKTERSELRSVVKQQFKVLRAEIKQREAELRAEANEQLVQDSGAQDKQWEAVKHIAEEAIREANRKINDGLREYGMEHKDPSLEYNVVSLSWQFESLQRKTNQGEAKTRIDLNIKERVRRAELAVERQEADLLRTLAVEALESEEARAFLKMIPSVAELVPSTRLNELIEGSS